MRGDVRTLDVKFIEGLNWCAKGEMRYGERFLAAYTQLYPTLAQLLKPNQMGFSHWDELQDMAPGVPIYLVPAITSVMIL